MSSGGILVCLLLAAACSSVQGTHPCARTCNGAPLLCHYDFTVEWYHTFTRSCANCPANVSDCYLPHCIAADGVHRILITVNRQLPGPDIQVCRGDTIEVAVHNRMTGGDTTTIHWHGVTLKDAPYMDGVSMVTQCPIAPFTSFVYRYRAGNSGTHFWHAHSGSQRADGVFGPLVIRDHEDPHLKLYDYDLPEHTMIVHDWFKDASIQHMPDHLRVDGDFASPSVLINGRGRYRTPTLNTTTPFSVFTVQSGSRYRFRVISNGVMDCPIEISVDKHNLTMIATDGLPFEPLSVESFVIYAGERFDFVLEAKQPVDNYWLRAKGLDDCQRRLTFQTAIVRYAGAREVEPTASVSFDTAGRAGKILNPLNQEGDDRYLQMSTLKSIDSNAENISADPDVKKYLVMDLHLFDWTDIDGVSPPSPVPATWGTFMPQINRISTVMPPAPAYYQYNEIPKELFCNEDTLRDRNCVTAFCQCLHTIEVKVGQLVELVMIDEGKIFNSSHPTHLHGHTFHVVAMQKINSSTSVEDVKKLDQDGRIKRNLANPVRKDTVTVPDGGYTVVRFRASNPGFWFLHCHVEFHAETGMGLFIKVGEPNEWTREPPNWPRCGGGLKEAWTETPTPKTVAKSHGSRVTAAVSASIIAALIAPLLRNIM